MIATLPLYIKDIGGTPQQVGFVMGAFALGVILTRPWLGKLADRRSRKLVVLIGLAIARLWSTVISLADRICKKSWLWTLEP